MNTVILGPDTPRGKYRVINMSDGDAHGTKFEGHVGLLCSDDGEFLFDGNTQKNCLLFGAVLELLELLELLEPLDTPFVPKEGETYYYPEWRNGNFIGCSAKWLDGSPVHTLRFNSGHCRHSAAKCQAICDELNAVLDKHRRIS